MAYRIAVWSKDEKELKKWVGKGQERLMLSCQEAGKFCKACGTEFREGMRTTCSKGRQHNWVLRECDNVRRIHPSPCHITSNEMQLSGMGQKLLPESAAEARQMKRAMEKIAAWPFEHDTKAVLVTPKSLSRRSRRVPINLT